MVVFDFPIFVLIGIPAAVRDVEHIVLWRTFVLLFSFCDILVFWVGFSFVFCFFALEKKTCKVCTTGQTGLKTILFPVFGDIEKNFLIGHFDSFLIL